jgi:hypothetical protein
MQYKYLIYDEEGTPMRWVVSKSEAQDIVAIREGWSFTYHQPSSTKPKFEFEESPF